MVFFFTIFLLISCTFSKNIKIKNQKLLLSRLSVIIELFSLNDSDMVGKGKGKGRQKKDAP